MANPAVGIIMGSRSDWGVMENAAQTLDALGIAYEAKVVSAHRTPDRLCEYAKSARARGLKAIIAGAGGAAHLPGMAAAMTPVPVLGVPVDATVLQGVDALMSIVQMPKGVPVATFAVGKPGARKTASSLKNKCVFNISGFPGFPCPLQYSVGVFKRILLWSVWREAVGILGR